MLRLIVNRARQHYNEAADHLERGRLVEALAELQNALELDAKFEEARILRGAIFLRLERPEDARREWNKALEANPQSARAHRYLNDLAPVSRVLPVVRRVYGLLGACAAVVLLSLAAVIAAQRPSDLENGLRRGWAAFGARRLADAQEVLRELPRPLPRVDLEDSARLLDESIIALEQRALAGAERALLQQDFAAASENLDALEAMVPTSGSRIALARLRRAISDEAMDAVISGDLAQTSTEEFHAVLRRLERLRPWLGENASMLEGQVRNAALGRLAKERAEWMLMLHGDAESPMLDAGAESLHGLAQLAGIADVSVELREMLRSARGAARIAEARRLLEANDIASFESAIRRAEELDSSREEAGELRTLFADRQREALIGRLSAALEEQNRTAALILAREAEQAGVALPAEWSVTLQRLRERRSAEAYYSLMERAEEIERGKFSSDEARAILDLVFQAREALPPRLSAGAQSHLHFFAAVALLNAGEANRAQEEIAALSELFSQSPYLERWNDLIAEP